VLFVEDVEHDAVLIARELKHGGFDVSCERVDTAEAMDSALDLRTFDIVISDWSMPRFSAPMALAVVKKRGLKLPFIIVSGTVSEELAVEALHAGAHDFIAKGKLARLNNAVNRGLRAAALRAEKAKMEEQLLVSDRMATVGSLTSSIAHEIDNPLAALLANLAFATEELAALRGVVGDGTLAGHLERVDLALQDAREASGRVREIARDLELFAQSEEVRSEAVDLRPVIESSLRLAGTDLRCRARWVIDLEEGLPPVRGSEGRLGQVFLNLILNAAQSLPMGRASSNEIRIVGRSEGGRVIVEVHDTGEGIPPASLGRIFDPFYTTRPEGHGTGLGLSICRQIVADLEGSLDARSELGAGTTIRLELPSARANRSAEPPPSPDAGGTKGRILVVDDEPVIRSAVRRMLAPDHDVIGISSVREAVERAQAGEAFDAVLCDFVMPELTGMDLLAEFAAISADLARRVIFMTDGSFLPGGAGFLEGIENPKVEKPFDAAALRSVLRSVTS